MDSKNACNMFFLTRLVRMKTKGLNCCIKYKFVKVDQNHVCTPSKVTVKLQDVWFIL